jgi:hypothetical protein
VHEPAAPECQQILLDGASDRSKVEESRRRLVDLIRREEEAALGEDRVEVAAGGQLLLLGHARSGQACLLLRVALLGQGDGRLQRLQRRHGSDDLRVVLLRAAGEGGLGFLERLDALGLLVDAAPELGDVGGGGRHCDKRRRRAEQSA